MSVSLTQFGVLLGAESKSGVHFYLAFIISVNASETLVSIVPLFVKLSGETGCKELLLGHFNDMGKQPDERWFNSKIDSTFPSGVILSGYFRNIFVFCMGGLV